MIDDSNPTLVGLATKAAELQGWTTVVACPHITGFNANVSFTFGLETTFKHHDLIICGVDPNLAHHTFFNLTQQHLRKDKPLRHDEILSGLLEHDYELCARLVRMGSHALNKGDEPLFALFFPDVNHKFPWEFGCSNDVVKGQKPLLDNLLRLN